MTSFAKTISHSGINATSPQRDFDDARNGDTAKAVHRQPAMVANDRPYPVPRPSPGMSHEVDRASFNARWAQEQREARKAAFKQMRRAQQQHHTRSKQITRSFNR